MKKANDIMKTLQDRGFEAYLVGGAVRDMFLDVPAKDWDIATNARPEDIVQIFENVNMVGATFGVCIVDSIDVATYRTDKYFGGSDKNVEIKYADTIEEDLSRRDLTINAIALDTISGLTGEWIDPHHGISDINFKVIRFVGNAVDRIYDDPCRILRACRILARIEGTFAHDTFVALKQNGHMVQTHVDPERIHKEIMKAMKYEKPSIFFKALHDIGVLRYIFPRLAQSYMCDGGVHHGETVFEHCMLCGDAISKKYPMLRLAGYLHDTGKPETFIDGKFISHEKVDISDDLLRLKFPHSDIKYITNLIEIHMRSLSHNTSPKAVRKLLARFNELSVYHRDFIRLRIADSKANEKRKNMAINDIKVMCKKIEREFNRPQNIVRDGVELAVTGYDVMSIMQIGPCKRVGSILKELKDIVIDDPELNTFERLILTLLDKKEI